MAILNDHEEIFKLSKITADELRNKLKECTGLGFENRHRMLKYENITKTLLTILDTRNGKPMGEIRANLNDSGTAKRVNEWLEDFRVNGMEHPEFWTVCSRFLMRALRGELKDDRQEYPRHEESKKTLMASLC
jgi:hypothetical protein